MDLIMQLLLSNNLEDVKLGMIIAVKTKDLSWFADNFRKPQALYQKYQISHNLNLRFEDRIRYKGKDFTLSLTHSAIYIVDYNNGTLDGSIKIEEI